jgi:glutamyl-tRNA reductase
LEESNDNFPRVPLESLDTISSKIGLLGVSFKTAPIEAREALIHILTLERLSQLKLSRREFFGSEMALLSTCNRIEIYYYHQNARSFSELTEALENLFRNSNSEKFEYYRLAGMPAVNHLFQVGAGLDSLVVGEAQILSQVREAGRASFEVGISGPILSRLFAKAYDTGRNARERNPEFSSGPNNSVSRAVLELISQRYGDTKPNLLLIGSGKMIRLAVRSIERSKLGNVIVAARRQVVRGVSADQFVQLSDVGSVIREKGVDVVIAASSAENYLIRPEHLHDLSLQERPRKLLVLDISVPRNVDPKIAEMPNVKLLNLDDLRKYIGSEEIEHSDAALRVRNFALLGATEFLHWLNESSEIAPIMSALRRKVEAIRSEEVANALLSLPDLGDEQKAIIEKMSERLTRRMLHDPSSRLRRISRHDSPAKAKLYANVISELFSPDRAEEEGEEEGGEHGQLPFTKEKNGKIAFSSP